MRYIILVLALSSIAIENTANAQLNQNTSSDSLAIDSGISILKTVGKFELYNYGQTTMNLESRRLQESDNQYYFGILTLKAPPSFYDNQFVSEISIYLSIDETLRFLDKLSAMLTIGTERDIENTIDRTVRNGITLRKGTPIWIQNKTYHFSVTNYAGNGVEFRMETDNTAWGLDKTNLEGTVYTSRGSVDFNVNDFQDYSNKVRQATNNLLNTIRNLNLTNQNLFEMDSVGTYALQEDYSLLIENGYTVYKSSIHSNESLQIIAEETIRKRPRKVSLPDYKNQFEDYRIDVDEQLNFYAEEIITFDDFLSDIMDSLESYGADGILDLKVSQIGDRYEATYTVVKSISGSQ